MAAQAIRRHNYSVAQLQYFKIFQAFGAKRVYRRMCSAEYIDAVYFV